MQISYRPEIDGLRAISILPVVFYHANYKFFSGGYIGVDIFFVVSGFLISSLIIKQLKNNTFSISEFYYRRILRIVPALLITVILSFILSYLLLSTEDFIIFLKSVISTLTFWSNFFFSFNFDYFDFYSEFQPLIHTWSLSIEEQFYIFFPIFMIVFYKHRYVLILSIIFFLSLLFSQFSGNLKFEYPYIDTNFEFYSPSLLSGYMFPFGRIWELIMGFFAAIIIDKNNNSSRKVNSLFYEFICLFGILLIIFSVLFFNKSTPYPSFYTLIPCFGAMLIIVFSQDTKIIKKFLSNIILVKFGLISYSLYLFHYVVFSFLKIKLYVFGVNILIDISIFSFVVLLSYLNWKFIENTFRYKLTKFKSLLSLFTIFISILFIVFLFLNKSLKRSANDFNLPIYIIDSMQKDTFGRSCLDKNNLNSYKQFKDNICKFVHNKKKIDTIIFGDSHIASYYNFFDKYFLKNKKSAYFVGYSGCVPLLNINSIRSDQKLRNCKDLNDYVKKIITENSINNIILISAWTYYTDGGYNGSDMSYISKNLNDSRNKITSRKAFEYGLNTTINYYKNNGTNVLIIAQPPQQKFFPKFVYNKITPFNKNSESKLIKLSVKTEEHKLLQNFVYKQFKKIELIVKNLNIFYPDIVFCKNNICKLGNLNESYYIDDDHLSNKGVDLMKNELSQFLNKNLK